MKLPTPPPPSRPLLVARLWDRLRPDPAGLVLGAVFFVLALTPSLLPRDLLFQGAACGLCAGTGYLLGVWVSWNWRTWIRKVVRVLWEAGGRSLPRWWPRWRRRVEVALSLAVILTLNGILLRAVGWQQEVAALTDSRAYTPAQYLLVFPVGFGLWMLLVAIGRCLLHLETWLRDRLPQRLPLPVRSVSSWIVVVMLVFALVHQAIPGLIIGGAEAAFSVRNDADPPNVERPTAAERSGSPGSLVPWETLGAYGKRFVGRGLSAQGLEEVTSRPAVEPIRVYAGLKSADTDAERAALVVDELERTGAASRSAVMIAPTTGTGWVDPIAALSLEVLYDGDTAIAAAQYSYLPSSVQFIADTDRARSSGRELVRAVVAWWRTLPQDDRPKLLLYGESLGVVAGEAAFSDLSDVLSSVDGVLWVGPPNSSRLWSDLVARRDPGGGSHLLGGADGPLRPGPRRDGDLRRGRLLGRPPRPLHPAPQRPGGVVVAPAHSRPRARLAAGAGRHRPLPRHALDAVHHLLPGQRRPAAGHERPPRPRTPLRHRDPERAGPGGP